MRRFLNGLVMTLVGAVAAAATDLSAQIASPAEANTKEGQKYALLVGVNSYLDLRPLEFASADQWALADRLEAAGFPKDQITVLASLTRTGQKNADEKRLPYQRAILKWLANVTGMARKGDVLVIAFSGHGIQIGERNYLCPVDADSDDPQNTMISVELLNDRLKSSDAALKLLVLDACRDDPRPPARRTGAVNVNFDYGLPPDGVISFRSCSRGKIAYEDKKLGHGVFMHYFLEGLDGKAANSDGTVTLGRLFDYVSRETDRYVAAEYGNIQKPVMQPEDATEVALVRSADRRPKLPKPGDGITNSIGMKLITIPAGEFLIGDTESRTDLERVLRLYEGFNNDNERPQHRVRITKPFALGAHEVTKGQFGRFVADAGYKTEAEKDGKGGWGWDESKEKVEQAAKYTWKNAGFAQTGDHPIVNVSWNDAIAFCKWLSKKEGKTYRLPTEAEWEYACRAGTTNRFFSGDDPEELAQVGNVADGTAKAKYSGWNSIAAKDGYVYTAPIGKFRPNGFGLYDMHGNVWEWCSDWYDASYYANTPADDPQGPTSGSYRVSRGGGWSNSPVSCRSASRNGNDPSSRNDCLGFRVALVSSQ